MCANTQRNKIGKEKGDKKKRKSASGLPLDQQIRALFFFKRTDQVGLMTATNQCIVLNPSSSNAEHEVSHSDRWKAQSSLTRTLPLPLHMLQTNYKPTLYCLLNTHSYRSFGSPGIQILLHSGSERCDKGISVYIRRHLR